jgi:hypothetical protein
MGSERAAGAGLTAAQVMDFWLWLWLGFAERERALAGLAAAPGLAGDPAVLTAELAVLEAISSGLSAELPVTSQEAPSGPTFARLQGGLDTSSLARLTARLAEPAPLPAARLRRRAAEVLLQARRAPPPSPARAGAVELWAWLTGAEADRRRLLAAAEEDGRAGRRLGDELRLLQTVQAGVRRGQPDVIPSHQHEGHWLSARQPFQSTAAADLARVLRRALPEMSSGAGSSQVGPLVEATASRLEALAGPDAVAGARVREAAVTATAPVRRKIAAGLVAAEAGEARPVTTRYLGRPVAADPSRLGATLVDADLGEQVAWRALVTPGGFDEAAEFSAAGAVSYELFLLVGAGGTLEAVHQRIDRSPHGRRWFAPAPAPRWLHPQGATLDVAWQDVAAPARDQMLALLAAVTSGVIPSATPAQPLDLALAARRTRRSRH